ncbi:MAG: PilZ domain-containing protein [Planctomycetota bacterium]
MTAPSRERRRAPRARADFSIQLNPEQGAAPAQLKDLSAIGLCCTTRTQLTEMTRVAIDLQLPGQGRRHRLEGAVVRCEPEDDDPTSYELAVYFTQIDAAAKQALGAYVEKGAPA